MKHWADFQKNNFFRRPDWRWERVLKMVDRYPAPGRCTRRDDKFVKDARNFILRWRDKDSDDDREELWLESPGLFYAHNLMAKAQDRPEGVSFLEARLLARQTPEQIAPIMGITVDTIRWYEALFFNVIDRLDQRDWITSAVLMPAIKKHHGAWKQAAAEEVMVSAKDSTVALPFLDSTLKLFAYFGGPYVVDVMITGFRQGKSLASPDDIGQWFDEHMSLTVRRRSAQAAMRFEINKYNVTELLSVHTRIIELEQSEEGTDQHRTTTERHIKAMVNEIPWLVGDQGGKVVKGTILGRLDEMAGELRDDEVLRLSSGESVPGLKIDFPRELPPPRTKTSRLLGFREEDL
jgi:hypothetical protein